MALTFAAQAYIQPIGYKVPLASETAPRNVILGLWDGIYARSELRQLTDDLSSGGLEVFTHCAGVDVVVVHVQQELYPL